MSEELPEGWGLINLDDVIANSFYGPRFSSEDYVSEGIPTIRTTDMDLRGRISLKNAPRIKLRSDELEKFRLLDGDLLVTRTGTIGRCALYTDDLGPAIPSAYLIRFRLRKNLVDPRFVLLFMHSPLGQTQLGLGTTAVAQPNVNAKTIGAFDFSLAPLPEQHRIVEKVEALLEQVNRAKERLDRVPLILKRFRQAVLAAACSGELTSEWRAMHPLPSVVSPPNDVGDDDQDNTDSFQPELPSTWTWVALDDACETVIDYRGRTPPTSDTGRIPHVRTTNVRRGKIDWNTESFVTEQVYQEYMTRGLPKMGDVIFTMEAPMGDAGVVDAERKFSLAQRLLLLRGKPGLLDGGYLAHILQASPVRKAIEHRATGTTVLGIAYKRFKYVRLPVPPVAEQKEIVQQVDRLFSLSDAVERRVRAATARANKLPQAILSKAFSGELVPTEAELARLEGRTYETAEALLKRVSALGSAVPSTGKGRGRRTRKAE